MEGTPVIEIDGKPLERQGTFCPFTKDYCHEAMCQLWIGNEINPGYCVIRKLKSISENFRMISEAISDLAVQEDETEIKCSECGARGKIEWDE